MREGVLQYSLDIEEGEGGRGRQGEKGGREEDKGERREVGRREVDREE